MTILPKLAAAAAIVTLAACGGAPEEDTGETLEANTLVVDNVTTTDDMNMDMNMGDMNAMDMNATTDMNATMDMNATANTTNTY